MTLDEIREAHLLVARCAMDIVRIATDPDRDFGALLDEMPRRQVRDLAKQIFFWVEQIEQEAGDAT